jgi:hypothetical protein
VKIIKKNLLLYIKIQLAALCCGLGILILILENFNIYNLILYLIIFCLGSCIMYIFFKSNDNIEVK